MCPDTSCCIAFKMRPAALVKDALAFETAVKIRLYGEWQVNSNNNLLILGAGQYGMVAKEIAESMGCFGKIDFLDDINAIAIDKLDSYGAYTDVYAYAIVAIGNSGVRLDYIRRLQQAKYKIAVLASPKAHISPSAHIMAGSIIEPMSVINTGAAVGAGTIVCAGAVVNHNATLGDGCLLQCGSIVTARSSMANGQTLGYGEIFNGNNVD